MKKPFWKSCLLWILFTEAVGALAGWLTKEGTEFYSASVAKPPLSPPSIVFPVAWVILYALMGIGVARIDRQPASRERSRGLALFLVQLAFNFVWSILFFNLQAYGGAFLWLVVLWFLILFMTLSFRKTDALAAGLQIPYVIWVAFAGYLNLGVWMLNKL